MATFESESDCFSVYVFSSSNKLEMMREVKSNLPSRQFGMHCARAHSLRQHDEAGPTLMYSFPRALGPPSFAAAADAARRPLEKRERGREQPRSMCLATRPPLPPSPPLSRNFCGLVILQSLPRSGRERRERRRVGRI